MKHELDFLIRVFSFLLGFAIVIWLMLSLNEWMGGLRLYLIRTGDMITAIILSALVLLITYSMRILLKMQFHKEFVERPGQKRTRRRR